jgi:PAS domain S-box-containing protein
MLVGHSVSSLDGTILSMDEAVCDLLHTSRNLIVGRSFVDITHPADRHRNVVLVQDIAANSAPQVIRKRYLREDGTHIWTDVWISRHAGRPADGRLVGSIHLASGPEAAGTPAAFWRAARSEEVAMLARIDTLGPTMFLDYPWLILIRLYLAETEGRIVDVSALKPIPDIADSSMRRWLLLIEAQGWITRIATDDRSVQLTSDGVDKIETLLKPVMSNPESAR